MKTVLVRRPVLMEDEGVPHPIGIFESVDAAKDWIRRNCRGYFGYSDFYFWQMEEVVM